MSEIFPPPLLFFWTLLITDGPVFTEASLIVVEFFHTGEAAWDSDKINVVGGAAINYPLSPA